VGTNNLGLNIQILEWSAKRETPMSGHVVPARIEYPKARYL
jgi:hypothetical protein